MVASTAIDANLSLGGFSLPTYLPELIFLPMLPSFFRHQDSATPPLVLAPLAGVSDFPFRALCAAQGACLTYIEMLAAQPIVRDNRRTLELMAVKREQGALGVQLTGRDEHEIGAAVARLDAYDYDTIDINMGCPVRKVVGNGCGSALLRDVAGVYRIVRAARRATQKPLSLKIRLGWDRTELNYVQVGIAAQEAGADWITVHGRTRTENYSKRVDLDAIAALKTALRIPVIGNGDLLSGTDFIHMQAQTRVDALMIARGALGNPWIFRTCPAANLNLDEWLRGIEEHLHRQRQEYGDTLRAVVCMRKHLLWYLKGWPQARGLKQKITMLDRIGLAFDLVREYADRLQAAGVSGRRKGAHGYDFRGKA